MSSCTLVTALFDIGRDGLALCERRTIGEYLSFMQLILSFQTPIVAYLGPELVQQVRKLRGDRPLEVRSVATEELTSYPHYQRIDALRREPRRRPERPERQLPLYNVVTFKKIDWLEEVARENPFQTNTFLWLDAGYGHGRARPLSYKGRCWPEQTKGLEDGRLHILQVHPIPRLSEQVLYDDHRPFLATGCFGGTPESIGRVRHSYHRHLERTLAAGLMDDDQAVMGSVFLQNPSWFRLIGPTFGNYFEMVPHLAGDRVRKSFRGRLQDYPRTSVGVGLAFLAGLLYLSRKGRRVS